MIFLLWLAALVGVVIASGALHTAAVIVLIVTSIPLVIGLLITLGVGGAVVNELRK